MNPLRRFEFWHTLVTAFALLLTLSLLSLLLEFLGHLPDPDSSAINHLGPSMAVLLLLFAAWYLLRQLFQQGKLWWQERLTRNKISPPKV